MHIPFFRGVFMRDTLPKHPNRYESVVLNHDSIKNYGTHWSAMVKINEKAFYFDSFGKLPPPKELLHYLGPSTQIFYNSKQYQEYGSVACGHLCLKFLHDFWKRNIAKA